MCIGINCGQQFEENAAVCGPLLRVCSVKTAEIKP
jgi:hypothetical protein